MIVETDLAKRPGFRNRGDNAAHQRRHVGLASAELSRLMWVQADPEPQRGPDARQFSGAFGFGRVFRRENAERMRQSGRLRPVDDLLHVFYKRIVCKMAVRVDHFADRTKSLDH